MAIFVAMLILKDQTQPDLPSLNRSISQLIGIENAGTVENDENVITFSLDDVTINTIIIPKALPWDELEGPCHTCRIWPNAIDEVRTHRAHAIVTVSHESTEPKELAWYLTKAIEALLPNLASIGVYWGAGTVVSPSKAFLALSRESSLEFLPLYIWLDFRCYTESEGRFSFFTTGLKALGLMEIEIKDSNREPSEVLDIVYNLAHYLLDNGPVIKNGQTFGLSADEKILVHHVPSFVDRDNTVYRLRL